MKNIEIFDGDFTVEQINSNPNKVYVISDNFLKSGFSKFRDLKNVITLNIKKGPSNKSAAYYSSNDILDFKKILLNDITKIRIHQISGKTIVLNHKGYGNVENISIFSTEIKDYLDEYLKLNLQFDNVLGKKFIRVPSFNEIENSPFIEINKLNYNTLNDSQIIRAILINKKIAISVESECSVGTLVKLKSKIGDNYLICRILDCYSCNHINPIDWSTIEICDINKYDNNKFQLILDFICTVNYNGIINFNNDIFDIIKENDRKEITSGKLESKNTDIEYPILDDLKIISDINKEESEFFHKNENEILNLLNQINSKLDILLNKHEKYTRKG